MSTRESGQVIIVDLCGRSTANDGETELLTRRLEELVVNGARYLLLNLSELTQIDSTGVSAIVRTYVRLRSRGGDLKLLRPRGHAKTVLGMLHLLQLMASFEQEEQAVKSFQPPAKFPGP